MMKLTISKYKCDIVLQQRSDRTIEAYAPFKMIEEFRSMIGYRYDKEKKCYIFSDCQRNLTQLMILKGDNPFKIYDIPLLDIKPRRIQNPDLMPKDKNFLPHQIKMFQHMVTRNGGLIAGDMGVGKTLSVIEWLEYLLFVKNKSIFWYIAPKSALHPNAGIPAELRKWKAEIKPILMTYEEHRKLLTSKDIKSIDLPDAIVFDECSKLKNFTSQRTEAAYGVSEQMRVAFTDKIEAGEGPQILLMSGTPSPKNPIDWWSLVEIGCPGLLRESSPQKLKYRLAVIEMRDGINGKYPHLVEWRQDEVKLLYRRLEGFLLRIRRKECIELPPSEEVSYYVKPNEEILRVARAINNSTDSTLNKLQKLRQLSDGFQYYNTKDASGKITDKETVWGGSPKLDAITDLLEGQLESEIPRAVIYAGYTAAIDKLVEHCINLGWNVLRLDARGWCGFIPIKDKNKIIGSKSVNYLNEEYFQSKDEDGNLINEEPIVIIAHPKSGGMSLNFTASNILIRYSCDFDGEAHMQSGQRVDRLGQTKSNKTVNIIHLPTDELILKNLNDKKDLQALSLNDIDSILFEPKE